MSQPSFLASGTTPLRTDTKSRIWTKILGTAQNRPGSSSANNPSPRDTLWRTKFKLARAMFANGCPGGGSGGGGGGGGGGTGDPDVDAFLVCSNIAQSQSTIVAALLALVTSLKNNSLWNSFDAIYPFVGGTSQSHSCNLRNTALYSITWHGGVTHDSNGITGNGTTGYGDTGFVPSTAGGQYALNSASLGVYCKTELMLGTTWTLMGGSDAANAAVMAMNFNLVPSPDVQTFGLNCADVLTSANVADFRGGIIFSRIDASTQTLYLPSGGSESKNKSSVALPTQGLYMLAQNFNGSASGFGQENLAFAFIGAGFSGAQVTTLKNTILTFENQLGRA